MPVPPHVPAAFVLQWWCEVAATPLAYAVRLGEGVVVPDPGGSVSSSRPGLHPHRIVVDPDRLSLEAAAVDGEAARPQRQPSGRWDGPDGIPRAGGGRRARVRAGRADGVAAAVGRRR